MTDIDPFPGKKEKIRQKYVLTDEQKAWLTKWHPITENKVLENVGVHPCHTGEIRQGAWLEKER